MTPEKRKPLAVRLDDPEVELADALLADDRPRSRHSVVVRPEPEASALPALAPAEPRARSRWPWGAMFWSAAGSLTALAMSLAVTRLIEDLFARNPWLGWFGLALAVLAAVALVAVIARETLGLARLNAVDKLRERALAAIALDDREGAQVLVRELNAFARTAPRYARGRAALESHMREIIDGADLVRLAERELMAPLDEEARRLVATAAKRVSVVTAVSPRAAVDMLFVFYTALRLIRGLAELYGGRPGLLGSIRLVRHVIAHLAFTGGMAMGDSLVQQMLGHGVAAKLSARLGEGVLNGLLTARLGLAAIEVTRPLPFDALPRPSMRALAGGLLRTAEKDDEASDPR